VTDEPQKGYLIGLTQVQYSGIVEKIGRANFTLYQAKIWIWRIAAIYLVVVNFFGVILEPHYNGSKLIYSCVLLFLSLFCELIFRHLKNKKPLEYFLEDATKKAEDAIYNSQVHHEIKHILGELEDGA